MIGKYLTYLGLEALFLGLVAVVGTHPNVRTLLDPILLALLALAALRVGRLLAYDHVAEPWRRPFTRTVADSSGAGMSVESVGKGWRGAIGDLLSCPICAGTWAALAMAAGLLLVPLPATLFVVVQAAAGAVELLDGLTETLAWGGRRAREDAGTAWLAKRPGGLRIKIPHPVEKHEKVN